MKSLLFLCHRIPYPPNKGDKIRSYNILKYLSKYYDIHLGAFVDDDRDFEYEHVLSDLCASVFLVPLNSSLAKLRSLRGFVAGSPLGLPYYFDKKMECWVKQTVHDKGVVQVLVYSSTMAQYVFDGKYAHLKRYIDFIDVDSDKWRQYSLTASAFMKPIYAYEWRKLAAWERLVAEQFDASFFVSKKEADLFSRVSPLTSSKVFYFNNGVDANYFSPDRVYSSPYGEDEKAIVFTGAMDYWVNVTSVVWFVNHIFPAIREKIPGARFYIIGPRPVPRVRKLEFVPGVEVVGAVKDIRPYLAHAKVSVAPMKIARGVQNKILVSMAMGVVTITTEKGIEGIDAIAGNELLVAEEDDEWVDILMAVLNTDQYDHIGKAARRLMTSEHYTWNKCLSILRRRLNESGGYGV